jgi:UDP-N-acetylmuramate--alanine ligase
MSAGERRPLHFIAIGGAGMSGLALVCHRFGHRVTGSDRAESAYLDRLRVAGIEPVIGHRADAVPADADVVVSTAIPEDNVELVRARERGQEVIHRSELLARVCAGKRLIAVAGAHGKTTTAGMIAHALATAGADPGFLLGGELPGAGPGGAPANADWGASDWVVAEADESDGSFLKLRPEVAVVTNVELDHHSHWGGESELIDAFARFAGPAAALVRPAETRFAALDGAGRILGFAVTPPRGSGPGPAAAVLATDIAPVEGGCRFRIVSDELGEREVRLAVPGRHNVANATAAIAAMACALDLDETLPRLEELIAGLESFPGMARRLERKGTRSGAVIYDDYAHHPTEVAASLAALRELPHRRLIAVFQPHLYSRTKALASRFGRALTLADEIAVLDVYPAREEPVGPLAGVSGLDVANAAADAAPGRRVEWLVDIDRAAQHLESRLEEGDLLVTVGAGDVFKLGDKLVEGGR